MDEVFKKLAEMKIGERAEFKDHSVLRVPG